MNKCSDYYGTEQLYEEKKWYLAITIKCVFCSSDTTHRSTIVFWLENKNWVFLSICWKTYLMTQKANISNFLGLLLINHFADNDLYKSNSEVSLHTLKDKLKAFDDFKNKQKGYQIMFLISKSMYVLKLNSIHYTLR